VGKPGSKRRTKAEGKPIVFRPEAAQPFDDRCLSWQHDARTVSIWAIAGRLNHHRRRQAELRRKLQAKATKSARRLLKRQRRKESRQAADIDHCISKRIVTEAERTCHGIGLEDLSGIRERAGLRKPQGLDAAGHATPSGALAASSAPQRREADNRSGLADIG
jgi:hypothetical protein